MDDEPRSVRLRIDLAYDGSGFSGWAAQPGRRTVEDVLAAALGRILRLPHPPGLTVAGRTDAGVHARGQVAHADVPAAGWPAAAGGQVSTAAAGGQASTAAAGGQASTAAAGGQVSTAAAGGQANTAAADRGVLARLAAVLPADVRVHAVGPAPDGFDARFSALWRRYSYRVCDDPARADPLRRHETLWSFRRLDLAAMNEAARPLLGEHEFAAFCRRRPGATTVPAPVQGAQRADGGRRRVLPQHGACVGRRAARRRRGAPGARLARRGARGRRPRSRGPGRRAARAVPGGGGLPAARGAGRAGRGNP